VRRVLVILVAAVALVPAAVGAPPTVGLPPGFVLIRTGPDGGTVWKGWIPNHRVNDPRLTDIYLPPNFSPLARYSVVIFLHGFWGSPSSLVYGLRLPEAADTEIAAGRARAFIAVMPPGGSAKKKHTSGEWAGVWEDYVVHDVVPWIDAHFRTIPGERVIGGLSAGAYGAVDIGLRHPTMFKTVESWGGYFHPFRDGPFVHAPRSVLDAHDPTLLVRRDAAKLRQRGMRFFLSTAHKGHGNVSARWTFQYAALLKRLRLPYRLWVLPVSANEHFWRTQLPAAIDYASPAT
jgi:hypothetical protein